jgi:membrane-bound lytic murein transglycosylase B
MQNKFYGFILSIFFSLAITTGVVPLFAQTDPPIMKFISPKHASLFEELVEKHRFDSEYLRPLFEAIVIRPDIIEKLDRPAEKQLAYYDYKKRFLEEKLVAKGIAYYRENQVLLTAVEKEYEVSKEVITAILGIETRFGEPGIEKYRAWDVYNTGYALYPRREAFFKSELIAFLALCKEENLDPLSIKSSYAGALGVPQFMPSSFLKFAMDGDGDQKRNLWSSKADIYASVAHYLKRAGWKMGGIVRLPAKFSGNPMDIQKVIDAGVRDTMTVTRATEIGIEISESIDKKELVSFALYKPEEGKDLFVGLFNNFRAIISYNASVNYAMVVTELSEILGKSKK